MQLRRVGRAYFRAISPSCVYPFGSVSILRLALDLWDRWARPTLQILILEYSTADRATKVQGRHRVCPLPMYKSLCPKILPETCVVILDILRVLGFDIGCIGACIID